MTLPSRTIAAWAVVLAYAGPALADQVSGTITRTYMIVEDTDLIGNVTCSVANGTPCFSFAAANIEFRLNGFSITGPGDAVTGCGGALVANEPGITTNGMARVAVRGPGLVQRFRSDGVTVIGSTDARVEYVTVSTNCMSGIRVVGTSFGTLVQGNIAIRNGSTAAPCGGI
jgi:hypothetical protein